MMRATAISSVVFSSGTKKRWAQAPCAMIRLGCLAKHQGLTLHVQTSSALKAIFHLPCDSFALSQIAGSSAMKHCSHQPISK